MRPRLVFRVHPTAAVRGSFWCLCVTVCLAVVGCEYVAVIARASENPMKPPTYVLPDETTLVMVDDPKHLLSNPGLTRQVATTAVHYLNHHKVLPTATFIEPRRLAALESRLGHRWNQTAIDTIAKELGAQQVIYAKVVSVNTQVAETLYRPEGELEVKVLRARDNVRLWPEAVTLPDPDRPQPGHRLKIRLDHVTSDSQFAGDATPDDLSRRLADEAGLRLAELFHESRKPQPGDKL
ncbi:MAG: hypothetical protein AAGG38_03235 [Planctomycetota bacterium]